MTIPGPIKVPMTVKEAASIHLKLTALLAVFDETDTALDDRPQIERGLKAIERELRKAGCRLDAEGWKV